MDKTNITVTMPITAYERLEAIKKSYDEIITILDNANVDGKAVMTSELERMIEEIYY